MQSAIGLERQLPRNMTLSLNYTNSRGLHNLRTRNINAPLPGTYDLNNPGSGVRPLGIRRQTSTYMNRAACLNRTS